MAPTKPQAPGVTTRRSTRISGHKNIAAGSDSPKPSPKPSRESSPKSSRQSSPKASTKKVVLKSILKSRATSSSGTPSSDQASNGPASPPYGIESNRSMPAQGAFAAQSLEMMKIALHVMVATLFSARGLLPAACFAEGKIHTPHFGLKPRLASYERFMERDLSLEEAERVPFPGAVLKIKKGVDQQADNILYNMEEGIFDAMAKFRLRAVQFDVLGDKNSLNHVLESYTITTSNVGWQGGANRMYRVGSEVEIDDPKDILKSSDDTKKSIGAMVRKLLTLSTSFPKLPRERAIAIKMHFMPITPEDYKPAEFENDSADSISFPIHDGWDKVTRGCGEFNTGYHAASLNVSYMRCRSGESSGSAAKRVLARLLLSQQDLPPWKSFGEPIRSGADIKLPQRELVSVSEDSVSEESDVDSSMEDTPTAALEPEGAVRTFGLPEKYQSSRQHKAQSGVRRRFFREKTREKGPFAFTKKADAEVSLEAAMSKADTRARWLNGEVTEDYPDRLDSRRWKPRKL